MKLSEKQRIFTRNIAKLIEFTYSNNMELTFGEAHRPDMMQKYYYENGLSDVLYGSHAQRLAVDFFLWIGGNIQWSSEPYKKLADYWISLHPSNRAGYYFKMKNKAKDPYHFEMQ